MLRGDPRLVRAWSSGLVLAFASLLSPAGAGAVTPPEAARAAYARAAAAYDRGDFTAAAIDFAEADDLVPNPVTLEVAIKAAIKADSPGLAMELAERSKRAAVAGTLAESVEAARQRFASRAATVVVRCTVKVGECTLVLDGKPLAPAAPRWVGAGEHTLQTLANDATDVRVLHVVGGTPLEVDTSPIVAPQVAPSPTQPPPVAPAAVETTPPRKGISPAWFGVAAGATAVAGAVLIGFGVTALAKHSSYETKPNPQDLSDGQSAQRTTNIMVGVTAAAAVATVGIGVFAVRWPTTNASSAARGTLDVGVSGPRLVAIARF